MQSPLLIVGKGYIQEQSLINDPVVEENAFKILEKLINGQLESGDARKQMYNLIGTDEPAERIIRILKIADLPMPTLSNGSFDETVDANNLFKAKKCNKTDKKKRREWSHNEDLRLLAGMHIYGINCWSQVAQFVGNDRTRAQCSQRWNRGLDPRILKGPWTEEEEKELLRSVKLYGNHSWKSVAACLSQRSDAQCRYRYNLIMKRNENLKKSKALSNGRTGCITRRMSIEKNSSNELLSDENEPTESKNIEEVELQPKVKSKNISFQEKELQWDDTECCEEINLFGFSNAINEFFELFFSNEWSTC